MLKITDLKAGYNQIQILNGADLLVNTGEIIALIGPNGAGKSTLLKSIFSLTDIYSGKILYKDKDITDLPTYELIELGISFVPQGRQVFSTMTVEENLEMGGYTIKDRDILRKNIEDIYQKFPILHEKRGELAANLSGGQQQLLAIARALIQNPQLLLMDEPSLGLSPKASKEIFEKIQEINKEGVTVLIVEQNAKQAVSIAHKTYVLVAGEIALQGGRDILQNKKMGNLYFGGV
ncbi:MAG TPA: ABC transporter ATP-binding protein [Candidatus Saccharimonadales bacterium]|nr:ABC transporter ATP-binding protein [Candidatus Saccharimonadales bacterium]